MVGGVVVEVVSPLFPFFYIKQLSFFQVFTPIKQETQTITAEQLVAHPQAPSVGRSKKEKRSTEEQG